jgi:hypothetical protein
LVDDIIRVPRCYYWYALCGRGDEIITKYRYGEVAGFDYFRGNKTLIVFTTRLDTKNFLVGFSVVRE